MRKILVLISILSLCYTGLLSQTLRIAYVDIFRIISDSNDTREAQRLFQIDRDNWLKEIDDMDEEIVRLERDYESRRLTLSESGKMESERRISEKIRERQQFIERIFGDTGLATTRNNELMAPIMEKLRQAVDKIAIEENYSIILDSSSGSVIWAQERLDITQQVINEMNRQ